MSERNSIPVRRVELVDSIASPLSIDTTTKALASIRYSHSKMDLGHYYFVKGVSDISNGSTLDILWVVPNTATWPHAQWGFIAEGELTMSLYEDVNVSASGVSITIYNTNRNSINTSVISAFTAPVLASGALGDGSNGGTLIWQGKLGTGGKFTAAGSGRNTSYEFIGKQNTLYWFSIGNSSGGTLYCDYDFNWYDHKDKDK